MGPRLQSQRSSLLQLAQDPTDGKSYYYAVARIPTGGWTLVLRQSDAAILAPIWSDVRRRSLLALSAIALIFGLLFSMTFRLSRRINIAAEAAERVARGDLTDDIAADESPDETGAQAVFDEW